MLNISNALYTHCCCFPGDQLEVFGGLVYALLSGPRPLSAEFPAPVPPYVSAAAYDQGLTPVYLLSGDTMYIYSVGSGDPPASYTYVGQFDVRGTGNLIQNAPCPISAMYLHDGDQMMIIFCGYTLYHYKVDTAVWTNHGDVVTPCAP